MKVAIELLGDRPARILETGSSAWGTNSSLLFDSYVHRFGGEFYTIDCGSAWKKDPVSGLIGVEQGPLIPMV